MLVDVLLDKVFLYVNISTIEPGDSRTALITFNLVLEFAEPVHSFKCTVDDKFRIQQVAFSHSYLTHLRMVLHHTLVDYFVSSNRLVHRFSLIT